MIGARKLHQLQQPFPLPGPKGFHQTQRHVLLQNRPPQPTPFRSPEPPLHKSAFPPLPPVLQGPSVDLQHLPKPFHPLLAQAMHHGRDQNHHHPHIHLATQKTHRPRSLALTAPLPGAAKTVALLPPSSSPRLPRVVPPMQCSPAMLHTPRPVPSTPNPIDFLQQLVYSPVSEYLLHVVLLLDLPGLRTKNLTELPQAP